MMSNVGKILIVADGLSSARFVRDMLKDDCHEVIVHAAVDTLSSDAAAHDLDRLHPAVLVLAFRELQAAREFYQTRCHAILASAKTPSRVVELCRKEEVLDAYQSWLRGEIDEYVIFWPVTHDAPRLRVAVGRAVKDLARDQRIAELEAALARAQRVAIEKAVDAEAAPDASLQRQTVLIVDDDPLHRSLAVESARAAGYHVHEATSGENGLEILLRVQVDMVLLDVQMPGINGLEVLGRLKKSERWATLPVLMMTSKRGRETVMDSINLGASDFIAKPFNRATLIEKMTRILGSNTRPTQYSEPQPAFITADEATSATPALATEYLKW